MWNRKKKKKNDDATTTDATIPIAILGSQANRSSGDADAATVGTTTTTVATTTTTTTATKTTTKTIIPIAISESGSGSDQEFLEGQAASKTKKSHTKGAAATNVSPFFLPKKKKIADSVTTTSTTKTTIPIEISESGSGSDQEFLEGSHDRSNIDSDNIDTNIDTNIDVDNSDTPSSSLELPKRVPKKKFFSNLGKHFDNHNASGKDLEKIQDCHKFIHDFCQDIYEKDSLFWKITLQPIKSGQAGTYFGKRKNGQKKFGKAIDIDARTGLQKLAETVLQLVEAYTVMTLEQIVEAIPMSLVDQIISLYLPAFHFHKDCRDDLVREIRLYIAEGINGCAYENDCPIYFERFVQLPSPKLIDVLNWERSKLCAEYAKGRITDKTLEPPESWAELIRFCGDIDDEGGVHNLFSWITLKSQNHESTSDFAKSQRPLPKEKFLKNFMTMKRCGKAYGGYTDAMKISPSALIIDRDCLVPLLDLLKQEDLDPEAVKAAIKTVATSKDFNQYMHPTDEQLGPPSKEFLKGYLDGSHSMMTPTMMLNTQNSNINAVKHVAPGWFEEHFDTENQLKEEMSTFVKSKDGTKKLVAHAAHYLIFTHTTPNETRLKIAKDYCLHQDLMMANGYLDPEFVKEDRLRMQCFFMATEFGTRNGTITTTETITTADEEEVPLGFRLARNSVFGKEWFKPARPGIKATSDALGIHEQVLIYLRDQLGQNDMRKVIQPFGLMKGNKPEHLAPYEPGAKCHGMRGLGTVQRKPCVCEEGEQRYLCYAGARSEEHAIEGYMVCNRCMQNNMRPIVKEHLRMTGQIEKLNELLKGHAKEQAKVKQGNLQKVQANDRRQNRTRKRAMAPAGASSGVSDEPKKKKQKKSGEKKSGPMRRSKSKTMNYNPRFKDLLGLTRDVAIELCGKPVLTSFEFNPIYDRLVDEEERARRDVGNFTTPRTGPNNDWAIYPKLEFDPIMNRKLKKAGNGSKHWKIPQEFLPPNEVMESNLEKRLRVEDNAPENSKDARARAFAEYVVEEVYRRAPDGSIV